MASAGEVTHDASKTWNVVSAMPVSEPWGLHVPAPTASIADFSSLPHDPEPPIAEQPREQIREQLFDHPPARVKSRLDKFSKSMEDGVSMSEKSITASYASNRLAVDGVAGPNTWDALGVPIDPSSHMYQRYRRTTAIPGDYDENVLLKPIPTWGGSQVSSQVPQPPRPKPQPISEADDMPIYQVTDGPDKGAQVHDYGFGPVHISGPESAELVNAGVRVVPISGATFANRFKGVK